MTPYRQHGDPARIARRPAARRSPCLLEQRGFPGAIAETPFLRIASRHAGNLGQVIDDLAKREGVALNAVQDVENVLTLLTLVSLGVGFSIMPDYVAQLSFRNIVTRPLTGPTVKAELMAAWRRDNAKAEVAALVRRLRELPADDL
jgi:LysR family hca operon transcriptional activator